MSGLFCFRLLTPLYFSWQNEKCASVSESRNVDRAFMDANMQLYSVDNEKQMVYVYHTADNQLRLSMELTFDQFFDCGSRKCFS